MTTRTVVSDFRVAKNLMCGTVYPGLYVSKTQNGSNDPVHRHSINPYTMVSVVELDPEIRYKFAGDTFWRTCTFKGVGLGTVGGNVAFDSNDYARLINKLGDKIRGHSFNAAVSVGAEGYEALEQVAAKSMEIYQGFKALRQGNIQKSLRHFGLSPKHAKRVGLHKDLSGRVLATQLGWIPLMSDVKDAAEAFHALSVTPKSQTYVASIKKHADSYFGIGAEYPCGSTVNSRRLVWTLSEQLSWNQSLGLSNPWDMLNAVWNATTLSFIADWFLPIGNYLSARGTASILTGSGYYTDYYKVSGRGRSSVGPFVIVENGDQYRYSFCKVDRVLVSSLAGMTALPSWKDPLKIPSWKRALTSVALATQMFNFTKYY